MSRQLTFKYAKAENFLCFGPEGVEIKFSNMGNIILIRGEDMDARIKAEDQLQDEEEAKRASNGTGKTSIPSIIVYTLFGKIIKSPKKIGHGDVINNKIGKKLVTEVIWDKYRVVRSRKPDSLRLWESEDGIWNNDTEITLGGMPATQKLIEDKLGLSYEAFVNIFIFTDDNNAAFLECDTTEKRQIVENLLSLEKYRDYSDNAKKLLKETKDKIKVLSKEYEFLLHDLDSCKSRVEKVEKQEKDWKLSKLEEMKKLFALIDAKSKELESSDEGRELLAWQEAQKELPKLNEELTSLEEKQKKIRELINIATEKYHSLLQDQGVAKLNIVTSQEAIRKNETQIITLESQIKTLSSKTGTKCNACYGPVEEKNIQHVVDHAKQEIFNLNNGIGEAKASLQLYQEKFKKLKEIIDSTKEKIGIGNGKLEQFQNKIRTVRSSIIKYNSIQEPKAGSRVLLIEQQIAECKKQALLKKAEVEGPSPFIEILNSTKEDVVDREKSCNTKSTEIKAAEAEIPYLEYWIKAFGDNGLRKWVIDGIIPALNSRIAYWLQFLIDNRITLNFDNQLEEKIERNPVDGSPFIYHVLSNGQRRRLNLAVSQAFAYVMTLNCGTSPSVVFLDEVTTNIDPVGVQGIYNMICELSKEKQVFVTTHDHDLLSLLHGCETVNLRMHNGITKIYP